MKRKLLASLLALCGLTAFAATEVKATFASLENGAKSGDYTVDGNCISGGTAWTYTDYITIIVKYSGLPPSGQQAIVTFHQAGNNDKAGVIANASKVHGLWEGDAWGDDGLSLDASGTIVVVYAPSGSTGVTVYGSDRTSLYADSNLKASSGSFGDAINFGAKHDGSMKLDGFKVEALQILKGAAAANEVAGLVAAFEEAIKPAGPAVEPVMLVNFYKDTQVDGWLNHTQTTGSTIPPSGSSITTNGVSFSTTANGNFFNSNWSECDNDFASGGTYTDVFGKSHTTIVEEVKSSLGLEEDFVFNASVYKTGLMNGGKTGHTATISGLTPEQNYVVYIGMGLRKDDDNNQVHGFKIAASGYSSIESRDYVTTAAGQNTTVATSYQTFNENTQLRPGVNGLLLVRLNGVKPTTEGKVIFTMDGVKGGLNFLAVAKVNETVTYTTAEIEGGSEISVAAINDALTETNNKAEVTLNAGATVYVDATPLVPTKFICEGSITLSNTTKPNLTNLDLSGVTGGVVRTWLTEAEKKGIGFNFAKGCGPNTSQALVETAWYDNAKNYNGTDCAFSSDGLTTITYTSKNTYNDSGNNNDDSNGTLVKGYLDDGNGDGVQITVKNIPFAEYAVIIYASTDQSGKTLSFKKVNGVAYTYDSANKEVAKTGEDAWGACQSSSSVEYGRNAIRVVAQTNGTLIIESKRDDSKNVRGCVSAIQIVPYRTFVEPTVSIASVETKCSSNYASNTITGTITEYVANSWTGDLTARVVVNSTVYESEAIADTAFSIEVSGLTQENVYRTVLEIGYTDGNVFTAIATQPVALYQGEQKFVWIASPFVIQEKTTVNDAQGLTIENPFKDADYVDLCDSEYTVSISASEEVDADSDEELDGTEQGGVRIAKTTSGLELQVIDNGEWKKFADAEVDTTYTMTVKFHYQKSQEDETADTSVMYALNATTNFMTNATSKKRVTEIFVSDGTKLSNDLWGTCQLDKAVVVDIELRPGEGDVIDYATEEAATAALQTLKVGICDAVKGVLTTADAQATYRSYFHLVVVPSKTLENGFSVQPEFTFETQTAIEKEIEDAMAKVLEGFNTGSTEIKAKPGLYYGVKRGDKLDSMNTVETTMATSEKVTIKIVKPENSKRHFYRIIVSPTPATK